MLTVLPGGLLGLEQRRQANVVLGHHSVEHVVRALGVSHRQLVELDEVVLDQREPAHVNNKHHAPSRGRWEEHGEGKMGWERRQAILPLPSI